MTDDFEDREFTNAQLWELNRLVHQYIYYDETEWKWCGWEYDDKGYRPREDWEKRQPDDEWLPCSRSDNRTDDWYVCEAPTTDWNDCAFMRKRIGKSVQWDQFVYNLIDSAAFETNRESSEENYGVNLGIAWGIVNLSPVEQVIAALDAYEVPWRSELFKIGPAKSVKDNE